jgi:hypothetical protein
MAFDVDFFVIGAGSGGVQAACIAAGHGANRTRTPLLDRQRRHRRLYDGLARPAAHLRPHVQALSDEIPRCLSPW